MNHTRHDVIRTLLAGHKPALTKEYAAFAPVNIALCKYWGKRDTELNLPVNDSLSISLGNKGSHTTLRLLDSTERDRIFLNSTPVDPTSAFYQRVINHIDLFRQCFGPQPFIIETSNTIATAAGLASSASGFAALTKALAGIYGLNLSAKALSIIARLGSGSACRSLFQGFVRWHKGDETEGYDSFATPVEDQWPTLRIGILNISTTSKLVSSREGMLRTISTCELYSQWPKQAANDIEQLESAIATKDFTLLGSTAEHNAMAMHATMLASWPPLFYWTPESLQQVQKVWQLREKGINVYLTMDAGPNIKLLFEAHDEQTVLQAFPKADVISPFTHPSNLHNP